VVVVVLKEEVCPRLEFPTHSKLTLYQIVSFSLGNKGARKREKKLTRADLPNGTKTAYDNKFQPLIRLDAASLANWSEGQVDNPWAKPDDSQIAARWRRWIREDGSDSFDGTKSAIVASVS
jgi:hypothetical protein